jgi:hypothetical protein
VFRPPAVYEVSSGGAFARVAATPVDGGEVASVPVPAGGTRITVRAVDEQGNKGRPRTLQLR